MGKVEVLGLVFNLIVFLVFSIPIAIAFFRKSSFSSKSSLINAIAITTCIEILLYVLLYLFPEKAFSIFPGPQGARNLAYYESRILFICAPFFALMFLITKYLFLNWNKKNTTIFAISKIVVLIIFMFLGNHFFNFKGILFSFPLSDLLYTVSVITVFVRTNLSKEIS